jgi:hypothetical protein
MSKEILFYRQKSQLICTKSEVVVRAKNVLQESCAYIHCQTYSKLFKKSFLQCEDSLRTLSFIFWISLAPPLFPSYHLFLHRNLKGMQCGPEAIQFSYLCSIWGSMRFSKTHSIYFHSGYPSRQLRNLASFS